MQKISLAVAFSGFWWLLVACQIRKLKFGKEKVKKR